MFNCLSARTDYYKKDDIILLSGNTVDFVGLVLSGNVKIIQEDKNGNIVIITELAASEIFGEVFACAGISHSPVTIIAKENVKILFINYKKIITSCTSSCIFHTKLIENMLKLIAKKYLELNQKIEILSKRTTREKLLAFFDMQRGTAKKFTIPFNREELAHYLCVDRSAMSNELCKMRNEGLMLFNKNIFELL
jgi:CRP-like cAMP-binding protein